MIVKYIKYFLLILLPLSCIEAFFNFAGAATISDQGSVVIDALVPIQEEQTPPPPGGGPIVPETIAPTISQIKIEHVALNSARISWITDELAIPQINYGTTSDIEKTYIGESYTTENSIFLEDLLQNTTYHFEIIATDRNGNRSSTKNLNFSTLGPEDITPPANVSGLKAKAGDSKIELSWKNPPDEDFDRITIARSEIFYPKSAKEGVNVYSGKNESFTDTNLANGVKYYYSVFSFDSNENISSGAVVAATPIKSSIPPEKPEKPEKTRGK